jgi:hypothetical protein
MKRHYQIIIDINISTSVSRGRLRTGASEDRWMVAPWCDEWLTTWCRLTLAEYYRCRLRLDLRWCRWRAGAKGLSLAGPPRSGQTSRLSSMDPVAERDQVRATWWQEKQEEVTDRSRCRVAAHDRSLHAGFAVVHHKTIRLLSWATKPRPEARRVETGSERAERLRSGGHTSGSQGLRRG